MTDATPPPAAPPPAGWYPHNGGQRYWDGTGWTEHHAPATTAAPPAARQSNGLAIASMILAIVGFLGMAIPFFIGLFIGGPLDLLALILGIAGAVRANRVRVGLAPAIIGIILSSISLISVFLGAGTVW